MGEIHIFKGVHSCTYQVPDPKQISPIDQWCIVKTIKSQTCQKTAYTKIPHQQQCVCAELIVCVYMCIFKCVYMYVCVSVCVCVKTILHVHASAFLSVSPMAQLHVMGMLRFISDINQPSLPTPYYFVLESVSVFMALSTVISFYKFSQQLSLFSLCSSSFISALLVLSTI